MIHSERPANAVFSPFSQLSKLSRLRFPAEWENQSAVQLTFPHAGTDWADVLEEVMPCFVKIAEIISRFQKVLVVCQDISETKNLLKNANPENLLFAKVPSNDTWARDHAGITVFENEKPVVLDFIFNGWGLKFPADKDNLITGKLFKKKIFKAKLRHGGLVLEGGALESDGLGTLLTTSECLLSPNRNPHFSKKQIENRLKKLFGLDRILWLNHGYLAGDDTDSHIDTLARFCDVETIAFVRCDDPTDKHFSALQKMEMELKTFRQANGEPYKLVALPMTDAIYDSDNQRLPATYANFLIINGGVLVPIYGVPQDGEALKIFEKIFADRQIIGINCRSLILQHGSLHCVTMQFPAGVI